uniref:Uncharacterized protein n=1 Tax=Dromaius novaehollandiae TaxID=8790 RepID=A0A8C4JVJ9_DRONO
MVLRSWSCLLLEVWPGGSSPTELLFVLHQLKPAAKPRAKWTQGEMRLLPQTLPTAILEQLALARKEHGWKLLWPRQHFWHRLQLEWTHGYVEALVSCNAAAAVSASAQEWAIKKHLCSPKGVTLEAGINLVVSKSKEIKINFIDIAFKKTPKSVLLDFYPISGSGGFSF